MKPNFIHRIVLIVSDVQRAERFYSKFLGKPIIKGKYQVAYKIGEVKLFLALPYHRLQNHSFNKNRIGLNHVAFGVRSLHELENFGRILTRAKLKHSGIQIDKYSKKEFIWFEDPDGIRLEFYL